MRRKANSTIGSTECEKEKNTLMNHLGEVQNYHLTLYSYTNSIAYNPSPFSKVIALTRPSASICNESHAAHQVLQMNFIYYYLRFLLYQIDLQYI